MLGFILLNLYLWEKGGGGKKAICCIRQNYAAIDIPLYYFYYCKVSRLRKKNLNILIEAIFKTV